MSFDMQPYVHVNREPYVPFAMGKGNDSFWKMGTGFTSS